jgi:hypothetical protein
VLYGPSLGRFGGLGGAAARESGESRRRDRAEKEALQDRV